MPQAMGMMQMMQMIMPIIEKLLDLFKNAMQNNQSPQDTANQAKNEMEKNGVTDRDQQTSLLKQTQEEAFNKGDIGLFQFIGKVIDAFVASPRTQETTSA
jgi:hypothetical protein